MPKRGHIAYGQKLHAYELYARNSAQTDNIHKSIEGHWGRTLRSGGSVVTISTVANWVKEFKQIPRDVIEQDKAFRLHKLSLYEIPWQDSTRIMKILDAPPVSFNKLPTGREAKWMWRLSYMKTDWDSVSMELPRLAIKCAQTEKYKIIFNRDSNLITFDHEDEDMNSIMEQIWKPSNTYFEQPSTQNVSNTKS